MSRRRRLQLALTFLAMLVGAAAELVTIGAVFPFLALLTRGSGAPARLAGITSPATAALLLAGAAVLAAAVRLGLLWITQRVTTGLSHDIARSLFARMLRQPYSDYVRRNSSEALASIERVRDVAGAVLQPLMQGAIGTIMALCIGAFLFILSPVAAAGAGAAVVLAYAAISRVTRGRLDRNSHVISAAAAGRLKVVQEAFGGMRDVILDRSQPVFEEEFAAIDGRLRRALAANAMISQGPRFAIEAAGIVAIAAVALWMSLKPGGIVAAIPVLGALALGSQRLLPLVQQAYAGWSSAIGNAQVLRDIAAVLRMPVLPDPPRTGTLPFREAIAMEGVSFGYGPGKPVLRDATLTIARGSRIGVVGPTGGGKSTLLDLLMGLLEPDRGVLRIDGRALDEATRSLWQAQIAHVPQSIFLLDDTITANIAFGIRRSAVDMERVRACAAAARLGDFLDELPEELETSVGERGIRLSGGQRQRIGIARALYKGAPVLILDEATSALDEATEAAVIDSIMALERGTTLIMVAHRRSTLAGCERILHVAGGHVAEEGEGALRQAR